MKLSEQNEKLSYDTVRLMQRLQKESEIDTEAAHIDADALLCALLGKLGFVEVVQEYHKVRKWYD